VCGSTASILRTLQQFGFEWDGDPVLQSDRTERYEAALESLRVRGLTFECCCSRLQLAEEERYPGFCRDGLRRHGPQAPSEVSTAIRLRVDPAPIQFTDRVQGTFRQDVAAAIGDFVLQRRDRLFAYVLAVVVDDAQQGVTHVVRGADLLDNTPRQIYLQRLLGVAPPRYAHVPVLTEADGRKLAKSRRSVHIGKQDAAAQLIGVFSLLGLSPGAGLATAPLTELWKWAIARWRIQDVPKRLSQSLTP
jgi:glutamyl-Q tRNA(Asp) synthetase